MVTVPNFKVLEALPSTPEEGEYALVEDEKKVYQYSNGEWNKMDMKNNMKANLYDINSTAIAQLPAHTSADSVPGWAGARSPAGKTSGTEPNFPDGPGRRQSLCAVLL